MIRPYLFGSVGVTFNDDRSESAGATPTATRQRGHGFDAAAALGLEWAPTERIRLGGHAGIRGMTGSGTFTPTTGEDVENETSGLTTFTSGIRAQLYF